MARRVPLGVVAMLTPYNVPLFLALTNVLAPPASGGDGLSTRTDKYRGRIACFVCERGYIRTAGQRVTCPAPIALLWLVFPEGRAQAGRSLSGLPWPPVSHPLGYMRGDAGVEPPAAAGLHVRFPSRPAHLPCFGSSAPTWGGAFSLFLAPLAGARCLPSCRLGADLIALVAGRTHDSSHVSSSSAGLYGHLY